MEIPLYEFSCKAGVDAGGEPDQTIANGATDFNPVWIRMILLLVSDLVKLGCIVNLNLQLAALARAAHPRYPSALSAAAHIRKSALQFGG